MDWECDKFQLNELEPLNLIFIFNEGTRMFLGFLKNDYLAEHITFINNVGFDPPQRETIFSKQEAAGASCDYTQLAFEDFNNFE